MSAPNIYINKLLQRTLNSSQRSQDVKHFIYVRSKWQEQEIDFTFVLAATKKTYKSRISIDELKTAAAEIDRNYQEFYDECKDALTVNISMPGFDYEIDEDELVFRLIKCEGFESVYLELKLREVVNEAPSSICDMLDTAIELLFEQKNSGTTSSGGSADADTLEKYQNYVTESKALERKMLQKFILLLNSKKEKIIELEEQLKEVRRFRRTGASGSDDGAMEQVTDLEDEQEERVTAEDADETIYMGETQAMTPPCTQKATTSRNWRIADDTDEEASISDDNVLIKTS